MHDTLAKYDPMPYTIIKGPDKEILEPKIVIIFLPINLNMYFGCSKKTSH